MPGIIKKAVSPFTSTSDDIALKSDFKVHFAEAIAPGELSMLA